MQRCDRELFHKSHDAYIEKSDRPHDHNEPNEMQGHHERPPPLAEGHSLAELRGVWLKNVDDGSDRSFRDGFSRLRCYSLAGPDLRMADVTARIPGSGHEAYGQERKNEDG